MGDKPFPDCGFNQEKNELREERTDPTIGQPSDGGFQLRCGEKVCLNSGEYVVHLFVCFFDPNGCVPDCDRNWNLLLGGQVQLAEEVKHPRKRLRKTVHHRHEIVGFDLGFYAPWINNFRLFPQKPNH